MMLPSYSGRRRSLMALIRLPFAPQTTIGRRAAMAGKSTDFKLLRVSIRLSQKLYTGSRIVVDLHRAGGRAYVNKSGVVGCFVSWVSLLGFWKIPWHKGPT